MTEAIYLIGAGGHARACIDVIEQTGQYHIAGILGLPHEVNQLLLGYPIIGDDISVLQSKHNVLVALGQIKTCEKRQSLYEQLKQRGCHFPTIISPMAYVSQHAQVAAGTIVMHSAVVNAGASVGENCIINTRALIEHDVIVQDHCHVSTMSTINGGSRVGMGSFLGSGSCVREQVSIGEKCLIGMGQVVRHDCLAGSHLPNHQKEVV